MELLGHATSRQSPALEVLIVAAQTVYSFLEKLMKQLPFNYLIFVIVYFVIIIFTREVED